MQPAVLSSRRIAARGPGNAPKAQPSGSRRCCFSLSWAPRADFLPTGAREISGNLFAYGHEHPGTACFRTVRAPREFIRIREVAVRMHTSRAGTAIRPFSYRNQYYCGEAARPVIVGPCCYWRLSDFR